jgi:5-methyltetrahydrofolate--homocysteine methyltransferase
MINSIKGEAESLEALLPLVGTYRVPFVALAMDEQGIARDVAGRLKVCDNIHQEVKKRDIDPALIYFDPLVMPLAADCSQAVVTCDCIREIKRRFPGANTIVGLSNVSHGLPHRKAINQGFLVSALMCGLDAAIVDPTHQEIRKAVLVGRALAGRDRHCLRYTRAKRREQRGKSS